ncbi:MAG: RNA polymerase sigma factor [Patescibacteria group bacterium]
MDQSIASGMQDVLVSSETYGVSAEAEGDFAAAFDDLAPKLYRFAVLRLRSKELAEDMVSQAFLRVWEYVRGGRVVRSYPAFLYQTLRNLIADQARGRRAPVSLDALCVDLVDEWNGPEKMRNGAEMSRVAAALNRLPGDQGELLYWRFVDGLSPADIALISGKKRNAVYVSLFRGIKNLQKIFPV